MIDLKIKLANWARILGVKE